MPGFDGLTLLEKLAEKEIDIAVVYISGYAEFEYAQRACRLGAFDYLLKPVEQEKMNDVLSRIAVKLGEPEQKKEELLQKKGSQSVVEQVMLEIRRQYQSFKRNAEGGAYDAFFGLYYGKAFGESEGTSAG